METTDFLGVCMWSRHSMRVDGRSTATNKGESTVQQYCAVGFLSSTDFGVILSAFLPPPRSLAPASSYLFTKLSARDNNSLVSDPFKFASAARSRQHVLLLVCPYSTYASHRCQSVAKVRSWVRVYSSVGGPATCETQRHRQGQGPWQTQPEP
eukprot:66967-Rhodomonas_salina.3